MQPIFLEEVPEKYYIAKDELLAASNEDMTVGELQYKVSRYLSSIQDGHTTLCQTESKSLYIDWKYINGNLYLLDDDKKLTNKVITKIGNVDNSIYSKVIDDSIAYIRLGTCDINFQLKNLKLLGKISNTKWIRPDKSKDRERVLEPDIYVEYGDEILEKAIEYINK